MNKLQATEKWVGRMNAIPRELIELAWEHGKIVEITPLTEGQDVYCYDDGEHGKIEKIDRSNDTCIVNGKTYELADVESDEGAGLPMWDTMWTMEYIDQEFFEGNIDLLADCGFRVYEYEETGTMFIGIDGAGYNFFEAHWIPLYEARGLHWHDEE